MAPERSIASPSTGRPLRAPAAFLAAAALAATAVAADGLVAELEQRVARSGVEAVNADLAGQWSTTMLPLNRNTANCELRAVSLTMRLARTTLVRAAQAHRDALREAMGRCPAFVLALASQEEVSRYCASLEAWSVTQTARELRRRIAAIEADPVLGASQGGMACRDAYLYELNNTRVVLRSRPPDSVRKGKVTE